MCPVSGPKPFSAYNLQSGNTAGFLEYSAPVVSLLEKKPKTTKQLRRATGRKLRGGLANQLVWLEDNGYIRWNSETKLWHILKSPNKVYNAPAGPAVASKTIDTEFDSQALCKSKARELADKYNCTVAEVLGPDVVGPCVRARRELIACLAQHGAGVWAISKATGLAQARVKKLLGVA